MFFNNGLLNKYNTDKLLRDTSLHSGIPKQFYGLKDKTFSDWEIPPWELYIFENRILGEGAFSKVYLAKWRETFVVAKVIRADFVDFKKYLIEREIDIMTKLHHPNIVQFLGYIDDPFILVMEYIPNGNLQTRIPHLKKKQKIKIMYNILQGINYLHKRLPYSLIHRDIKPTNIILTNSNFAKITDFGLSKFHCLNQSFSSNDLCKLDVKKQHSDYSELTDIVGTEKYMAPELKVNNNDYTNAIDIYSTGILLYEMFENKKYIPGSKLEWYWCPKKIKNIITDYMLKDNPQERWSAESIIHHLNHVLKN
jgi:serine/threonine protein kinase